MNIFQTHLIRWPSPQAVGVELVDVKHVNGTFNTEVMELTTHFKEQQVVLKKIRQDQSGAAGS